MDYDDGGSYERMSARLNLLEELLKRLKEIITSSDFICDSLKYSEMCKFIEVVPMVVDKGGIDGRAFS